MEKGYKKEKKSKKLAKGYELAMPEMRPTMSVDENQLAAIKNFKVGKTYKLEVEVEMTGVHKKYDSDKLCADFEIISVESEND